MARVMKSSGLREVACSRMLLGLVLVLAMFIYLCKYAMLQGHIVCLPVRTAQIFSESTNDAFEVPTLAIEGLEERLKGQGAELAITWEKSVCCWPSRSLMCSFIASFYDLRLISFCAFSQSLARPLVKVFDHEDVLNFVVSVSNNFSRGRLPISKSSRFQSTATALLLFLAFFRVFIWPSFLRMPSWPLNVAFQMLQILRA
jgi:hypothetical protein